MKQDSIVLKGEGEIYWEGGDIRFWVNGQDIFDILESRLDNDWHDSILELGKIKLTIEWLEEEAEEIL